MRALAVIAVLLYHADLAWIPGGFLGVEVFFVISGYLITALLLAEWRQRGRIDLKTFWLRRARRLLPALYVLLVVTLAFAVVFLPGEVAGLRGDVLAAFGYVTNWYLIFGQESYFEAVGRPSLLQHLWSLAVEEQFYLIWPFVVMALPSRHFLKLCVALIACTVLYRVCAFALGKVVVANALPFDSIDALAAGALLSFLSARGWTAPRWLAWSSIPIGLAGVVVQTGLRPGDLMEWVVFEAALLLPLTMIVAFASKGQLLAILANPLVSGLGRISYGAYLYHLPIWAVFS